MDYQNQQQSGFIDKLVAFGILSVAVYEIIENVSPGIVERGGHFLMDAVENYQAMQGQSEREKLAPPQPPDALLLEAGAAPLPKRRYRHHSRRRVASPVMGWQWSAGEAFVQVVKDITPAKQQAITPKLPNVEGLYSSDPELNECLAEADRRGWLELSIKEMRLSFKAQSKTYNRVLSKLGKALRVKCSKGKRSEKDYDKGKLKRIFDAWKERQRHLAGVENESAERDADRVHVPDSWWKKIIGRYFPGEDWIRVRRQVYDLSY